MSAQCVQLREEQCGERMGVHTSWLIVRITWHCRVTMEMYITQIRGHIQRYMHTRSHLHLGILLDVPAPAQYVLPGRVGCFHLLSCKDARMHTDRWRNAVTHIYTRAQHENARMRNSDGQGKGWVSSADLIDNLPRIRSKSACCRSLEVPHLHATASEVALTPLNHPLTPLNHPLTPLTHPLTQQIPKTKASSTASWVIASILDTLAAHLLTVPVDERHWEHGAWRASDRPLNTSIR